MRKMRCDSTWNALTAEQRVRLDGWLFADNLGYRKIVERVKSEWGVTGTEDSLGRYYQRRATERAVAELRETAESAAEVSAAGGQVESLRSSSFKLIGKRLLETTLAKGSVNELAALGRLLLEQEEREIERGRLELAREKFQFKAAEAALAQLPKLNELSREDDERAEARLAEIKDTLFGPKPEGNK